MLVKRYPLANQVGIDAVAQCNAGHRHAGLQAFLDYLGFEGFGIRRSLAHGNPDDKGDGVHVFLGGEHRPYCWDRVGDFAGRLRLSRRQQVCTCSTERPRRQVSWFCRELVLNPLRPSPWCQLQPQMHLCLNAAQCPRRKRLHPHTATPTSYPSTPRSSSAP